MEYHSPFFNELIFFYAFLWLTCLQSESDLGANNLSFPSIWLHILHLKLCNNPFDLWRIFAQGNLIAHES
jgi:hypothetical protein